MGQAKDIKKAANFIQEADVLSFHAGAGMGVDSGLPDFRGNNGFWKAYPAFEKLDLNFMELANPRWFVRDPQLAWGFYGHRLNMYRATQPHAGFHILKKWADTKSFPSFIFTSNVDGHFQKAGFKDVHVYECHGSINHLQCNDFCCTDIWQNESDITVDEETCRSSEAFPRCPHCGAVARPNILMFGDSMWLPERSRQQMERYLSHMKAMDGKKLVIVELGAGTAIPTVRWESMQYNATVIRINLRESSIEKGHIGLALPALEALRAIDEHVQNS